MTSSAAPRAPSVRFAVWVLHVAGPLLVLWLLIARPELDLRWDDHIAHFVLVGVAALISVGLGARLGAAARQREDARLLLVSLAFLASAGFLGLHALATPGVLVESANAGFTVATPVGLLLGGALALASTLVHRAPAATRIVLAQQHRLTGGLAGVLIAWAVVSVAEVPPLDQPLAPETATVALAAMAVTGTALYALSAIGYLRIHRRRGTVMLLSLITAYVLLAEAMIAMAVGRPWQASWWEWHLLMALAYGFIAYGAHVQYRREGTPRGVFDSVALEQTFADLRQDYTSALEEMVEALDARATGLREQPFGPMAARLAERFDLTDRQVAVLERAAVALGREREQGRRLEALVAAGHHASVIRDEDDLLAGSMALATEAFRPERLRLGLVHDGVLAFGDGGGPVDEAATTGARETGDLTTSADRTTLALPVTVKGKPAGLLEAHRATGFDDADRALLSSFASQLGIALENARLYRQLDGLFRSYLSPDVATALLADPAQARLGGATREVSVLMADLKGFTPFSERSAPEDVVAMLNTYYGAVVPVILDQGGTVVQFVGDAVMAVFNAPVCQADHARRAAHAGLRLQQAATAVTDGRAGWPRFRVGINTGPALVGNIGADKMRNFTAIGDTTNLAARLEGLAEPGHVVVGPVTREQLGDAACLRPEGEVAVKGKREPVPVFTLLHLEG